MNRIPLVTLADGQLIPQLGIGTWPMNDDVAEVAIADALKAGYRLVDTASKYGNETGVGRGIRASGIPRSEVFLTTKLRGDDQGFDAAVRGCEDSLKRLGVDYVDLYLIHWPLSEKNLFVESWKGLVRLQQEGKARSIGVSNFNPAHLERIIGETGVTPVINQIEVHPGFTQSALRQWLAGRNIGVQAWSPIGRGELLKHPSLKQLSIKHSCTPAQIILRWHLVLGMIPIPKSQNPVRMRQNLDVLGFELDANDLAAISALNRDHRQGGDPETFTDN
jgi:2,5-diketo-D-gluconate reductase A